MTSNNQSIQHLNKQIIVAALLGEIEDFSFSDTSSEQDINEDELFESILGRRDSLQLSQIRLQDQRMNQQDRLPMRLTPDSVELVARRQFERLAIHSNGNKARGTTGKANSVSMHRIAALRGMKNKPNSLAARQAWLGHGMI